MACQSVAAPNRQCSAPAGLAIVDHRCNGAGLGQTAFKLLDLLNRHKEIIYPLTHFLAWAFQDIAVSMSLIDDLVNVLVTSRMSRLCTSL